MNPADPDDDVGARLARDAASFPGVPSAAARAALRARLAALPVLRRRAPRWLLPFAAAAAAAVFAAWPRSGAAEPHAPAVRAPAWPSPLAGAASEALRPLQVELAGLTHDAAALARGIWGQVPAPLRHVVR